MCDEIKPEEEIEISSEECCCEVLTIVVPFDPNNPNLQNNFRERTDAASLLRQVATSIDNHEKFGKIKLISFESDIIPAKDYKDGFYASKYDKVLVKKIIIHYKENKTKKVRE